VTGLSCHCVCSCRNHGVQRHASRETGLGRERVCGCQTDRAFAAIKTARTFACEGLAHIASTVDRGNIAGLVERVVVNARADHGRARAWAMLRATTTPVVAGHAALRSVRECPVVCYGGKSVLQFF